MTKTKAQQIHELINENNFSEVFRLLKMQNSHIQQVNRLENTFLYENVTFDFIQRLRTLTNQIFSEIPKKIIQMEETLLASLIASYGSGAITFLQGIGVNFAYDKLKNSEQLQKLSQKVLDFFKGKPEEDTLDALESAVSKKNTEKFNAKSKQVMEILKNTVENNADFRKDVENILNGLDEKSKNELGKITQNISTILGNDNTVVQGVVGNVTIHKGDVVHRDKIKKQFNIKGNFYENKSDTDENR